MTSAMDKSSFQCCILTFGAVQNGGTSEYPQHRAPFAKSLGTAECPQHRAPFAKSWHCGVPPAPCTFRQVLALRSAPSTVHLSPSLGTAESPQHRAPFAKSWHCGVIAPQYVYNHANTTRQFEQYGTHECMPHRATQTVHRVTTDVLNTHTKLQLPQIIVRSILTVPVQFDGAALLRPSSTV
ncbi:hypothetical protein J6590_038121 [Homalodisca vitripennis]|nr:hypothetical protein J6590_038121 [Homalodisca vitripennis]